MNIFLHVFGFYIILQKFFLPKLTQIFAQLKFFLFMFVLSKLILARENKNKNIGLFFFPKWLANLLTNTT